MHGPLSWLPSVMYRDLFIYKYSGDLNINSPLSIAIWPPILSKYTEISDFRGKVADANSTFGKELGLKDVAGSHRCDTTLFREWTNTGTGGGKKIGCTWNPKQPFINGCFNWMIPNLYIGNGWKSPNIHFKVVVWGSRYMKDPWFEGFLGLCWLYRFYDLS